MKEGEGISQRTGMSNPRTQTTAWWWPEGRGAAKAGDEDRWTKGRKKGTSVIV